MTFEPEKEGGFMLNIWHKSPILVPLLHSHYNSSIA